MLIFDNDNGTISMTKVIDEEKFEELRLENNKLKHDKEVLQEQIKELAQYIDKISGKIRVNTGF